MFTTVELSGKAHEDSDYTAMITIMHWCLHAKTHPGGEVVNAVIICCFPSGHYCSLNWTAMVEMARALIETT